MNGFIKVLIVFTLLPVVVFGWGFIFECPSIAKNMEYMKEYVGDTVLIKNQEYIITDYSYTKSCYMLDNGTTIHMNFIDKFKKK